MQVTLDSSALKPFTKALTCLSKYGDELTIYATLDTLSLSATNSSKSAYCRFKYENQFFSKYRLRPGQQSGDSSVDDVEVLTATGQLLTKALLSTLKHRTVEKTVERCELSIVEGIQPAEGVVLEEDQDSLESKLILRLHCKHGVVKTHRLLLQTPTSLMAPGVPDATNESRLTIGPKSLKDMIEHFPLSKGAKSDPQLVWSFGDTEVALKSMESSIDSRGKGQLSTELTISTDEFDVYDIFTPPMTLAFHLREFNATIAFADSMALTLDLRFTDPAAPLFIDIEGDCFESLFVISTSQVHGAPPPSTQTSYNPANNRKRDREETPEMPRVKKPMKVVQPAAASPSLVNSGSHPQSRASSSMPPPSSLLRSAFSQASRNAMPPPPVPSNANQSLYKRPKDPEPLFLPSSQLSAADEAILRETGLGIEDMGADELAYMLEGDGEEVAFDFSQRPPENSQGQEAMDEPDSLEIIDEVEFDLTQTSQDKSKLFHPLFED
ncbi:Rad9-domain-containing protein [Crucibulum laeve]|uniref:Rad9-domain-containing protein n=1 Tax=Crucibulum laeve TaxID=68775 RepID=A0A5C3MIR0_9AGAR|nr:Rad9-domain-containing protein [Crucibulum laeve]